jgi:hypothetical protein
LIWALACSEPAAALDVTLDSGGSGSTTITDTDLDGIIDFDLVVGGVFRAKGRVFESFGTITKTVTLTSTPPDTEAVFGKLGVGAGTAAFTVTVNTTAFTATGPPLGWTVSSWAAPRRDGRHRRDSDPLRRRLGQRRYDPVDHGERCPDPRHHDTPIDSSRAA